MQINFGGISTAVATRTLELFAREVMPAFPEAPAGRERGARAPRRAASNAAYAVSL